MSGKRKVLERAAWWALMAASAGAVAFIWAVVRGAAALERLLEGDFPDDDGPDDGEEPYPGLTRVYAPVSDFRSMDERRDT